MSSGSGSGPSSGRDLLADGKSPAKTVAHIGTDDGPDIGPGPALPKGLITVDAASHRLLALVRPLPSETIPLAKAAGRWLSTAASANRDQPPFDASAMDGYALCGSPAIGDSFHVIGEAGAGHAFAHPLGQGQALRIFTGAPVPDGADRVVIQENTQRDGDRITITALDSGKNIRLRGQDFTIGTALQPRRLRPTDLALLAAMNLPDVSVARRPEVAILATGDELVLPGETPRPDQIIASNGYALKAMAEAVGAKVRLLPIARDTLDAHRAGFALAAGADVIVTIGGASVGDHDLVGRVARDLGLEPAFWKLALRPGKPLMAGQLGDAILLGLPGNPVSAIVCGQLFLLPLLRALQGDPAPLPRPQWAPLAVALPANGPRAHYMRAQFQADGSIAPVASQDSALLRLMAEAEALLIRPIDDPARPIGAMVPWLAL